MRLIKEKDQITITDLNKLKKYPYKQYNRYSGEQGRRYLVDEKPVPSVTTILSNTKDRKFLDDWIRRVGKDQADKITKNASDIGSEMHLCLEHYLSGDVYYNLTPWAEKPRTMAHKILENLEPLQEVWGNEISLAYKDKYAGTADLVALYDGEPTIIDFKQANRPKKEEWVEDYKLQLGAYYLAHREAYGPIRRGLISICTRDLTYQSFMLREPDLSEYSEKFLERVDKYNDLIKQSSS
tara:strand:- start:611 stop:1327 length:717 start_codon:yes stop_codon:yes gene_type:complete